jgi:hypothetical protein
MRIETHRLTAFSVVEQAVSASCHVEFLVCASQQSKSQVDLSTDVVTELRVPRPCVGVELSERVVVSLLRLHCRFDSLRHPAIATRGRRCRAGSPSQNKPINDVYPNRPAPVVIEQDGKRKKRRATPPNRESNPCHLAHRQLVEESRFSIVGVLPASHTAGF